MLSVISKTEKEWLENIKVIVQTSLEETPINVEQLAKRANLGLRQLNRKLNLLIGLSPNRFIREVQLEAARKILESGSVLSVSEVAYRCGFD